MRWNRALGKSERDKVIANRREWREEREDCVWKGMRKNIRQRLASFNCQKRWNRES